MTDNVFVYFLVDKKAGVKWNCFLFNTDDAALRNLKLDIYKFLQDKRSGILTQIADSQLCKYAPAKDGSYKIVVVKDLKDLVPFDIDLTLKKFDNKVEEKLDEKN